MPQALFLRRILALDALACAGMGIGLALGAGALAPILGLPEGFMRGAGLLLLPVAAFIFFVGSRPVPPALLVWVVILGNLAWTVGSVIVPGQFAGSITALGLAFTYAQAAFVLAMSALEYAGLRRIARLAA